MIRDLFQSAGGYEGYGMISMIIFLAFFVMVVFYAMAQKKTDMDEFSRLPLDDQEKISDEDKDI
jgi:cbb3-type cytochrome oxidase subunit 3